MKNFTLVIIAFVLMSTNAIGQFNISFDNGASLTSINTCGSTQTELYTITNNGGNTLDTVFVYINLDNGIVFDSLSTTSDFDTLSPFDPANPVFFFYDAINGFGSSPAFKDLDVKLRAECPIITTTGSKQIYDTATVYTSSTTYNSAPIDYPSSSSVIQFLGGGLDITNATVGQSYTRDIVFDISNVEYDGFLKITDSLLGTGYRIDSFTENSNFLNIVSRDLSNPQVGKVIVDCDNYAPEAVTLTITEHLTVVECLENGNGESRMICEMSCDTTDFCYNIKGANGVEGANVIPLSTDRPILTITELLNEEWATCSPDAINYKYQIINTGTSPALNVLLNPHLGSFNIVDTARINIYGDTSGIYFVDTGWLSRDYARQYLPSQYGYDCAISTGRTIWRNFGYMIPELAVGDTIFMEYETFHCCPPNDGDRTVFGWNQFFVKYHSACDDQYLYTSPRGNGNQFFDLQQEFNSTVTNMVGDTAFKLDIKDFRITNTASIIDNVPPINPHTAKLHTVLSLDSGLCYVDSTLQIESNNPNFNIAPITPESVWFDTLYPPTNEEPKIDVHALFCLDSNVWNNSDTNIFHEVLFSNTDFYFQLMGCDCPAELPQLSDATMTTYLRPDTCQSGCEYVINRTGTDITVQCPGCVTPGMVVTDVTVERLNTSFKDDDNTLLPDSVFSDVVNNWEKSLATEGDTIEFETRAVLFEGIFNTDSLRDSVSSVQLSYEFINAVYQITLSGLSLQETQLLQFTGMDVELIDGGSSSGWVTIPSNDISSFLQGNDIVTGADGNQYVNTSQMWIWFNRDTLFKYGISGDPNFAFEIGDRLN